MSILETFTHSTFAEQLNTKFRFYLDEAEPVEMELISVGELKETKRQEMFSIQFKIPDDVKPKQGSYKVEHDKLGTFDLFIVPVLCDNELTVEAVFNRMKKKTQAI